VRFLRLRRIHFVGAGGVGMSGLAEILLLATPLQISGCDLASSENTRRLEKLGARIAAGHDPSHVEAGDEEGFRRLFGEMLELARSGAELGDEELEESHVILPPPDISLEEASVEFTGEGLIPG